MIPPLHHHIAKRTWNWLTRFRHRQGYGIHSPYAFNFVTGVVYESGHYYADAMLKKVYAQAQQQQRQGLRLKDCRLLFRLANFQQAHCCRLVGYDMKCLPVKFMQAACTHTRYVTDAQAMADMVMAAPLWPQLATSLIESLPVGGMLVLNQVAGANKQAWLQLLQHPNAVIAFDLHDFGIIINHPDLQRQHYVVNFY